MSGRRYSDRPRTVAGLSRAFFTVCVLVLLTGAGMAAVASGSPERRLVITGRVTNAVTDSPVRKARIEVRRPGHEDMFTPRTVEAGADGTYRIELVVDEATAAKARLTVTGMADGFGLREIPLTPDVLNRASADSRTEAVVDIALQPATLNGVLDIFSCCVLNWSVVTVMLPAFLLGAAIRILIPSHQFLRYLGPDASQPLAYGAAVGSGMVLSLCSCNVVPLFVSIWRSGAGIGPAFAFLFAGPAINVLSMAFTCKVIGVGMGIGRVVAVAVIAVIVGSVMSLVFGRRRGNPHEGRLQAASVALVPGRRAAVLLGMLLVLLIEGGIEMSWWTRLAITAPPALLLAVLTACRLPVSLVRQWMRETLGLILRVIPILIPAVLIIGVIAEHIPLNTTIWLVGNNSVPVTALAATVGAFMYFPIMTEVAFTKAMLKVVDIGVGPAMALMLTAPGLSLPGMLIVYRDIRMKRLATYVGVIIVLATLFGLFFGSTWGQYICNCKFD